MRLRAPQPIIVPTFIPSAPKFFSDWPNGVAGHRLPHGRRAERKLGKLGNELGNRAGLWTVLTPQKTKFGQPRAALI